MNIEGYTATAGDQWMRPSLCRDALRLGRNLLPSVRGDLLAKLGRLEEARAEFLRAAALTNNARERALLLDRASSDAMDRNNPG